MELPRQLVKEPEFDEASKRLFGDAKNADVSLEAAEKEFVGAEDLTIYPLIDEKTQLRAYKSGFVPVADQIIIFFVVEKIDDGEKVYLYDVIKAMRMSIPWSDDLDE